MFLLRVIRCSSGAAWLVAAVGCGTAGKGHAPLDSAGAVAPDDSGASDTDDSGAADSGTPDTGPPDADEVGFTLSGAGDVDGDGFDDLLVGLPYDGLLASVGPQNGRAIIYFGTGD